MKRIGIAILAIAIATFALAASTPAMAVCTCDVETTTNTCNHGTNGTVNGTIYVDGDGENELGQNYVQVDFDAIPAGVTITWARVYWHIWMPGVWTDATFCNATQCWENNQTICDPSEASCTCVQDEYDGFYGGGCGTTWVYWNVTNNVTSGEQHNITIDNRAPGADGRTMWVYLVAVLEDSTTYSEMHYWVNQGYEDLEADDVSTTWFSGPVTTGRNGTLWHLALTAGESEGVWFNGHKMRDGIPRNNVTKEEIPSGWIENDGTQNMTWNNTGPNADNWLHPVMAIFMDNVTTTESGKDLIVEDIEFPTVMRPNTNHTIHATIKNQGSETTGVGFNVSLYVDNVEKDSKTVAALSAGNSIDVTFTVTLPADCHTFTVVADSDGDVSEVDEANNASSEKYQVGYVVVVKSDDDFEKLNTSGDYALPTDCFKNESGTYYIQDLNGSLSIENCMGNGITIENTNATFVIKNCTIRNCKDSGVFFHNLSNGTVNDSIMQNNTKYGIESGVVPLSAEDPKLVTITNSKILENKLCGIELIGCNFTVRNNTVRNNTQQGMYLLANHSAIYNNTIAYNDDYGVKLYNSFGNDVYANIFTDNKASNPGHQAWDNGAVNNNRWNTTAKGNWWSDWVKNSGFTSGTYEIDGGNNKDYKPEGPHGPITTITVEVDSAEKVDDGDHTDVTGDVNQSDDAYATIGAGLGDKSPYVQVNFSTDITNGSMINSVIFYYRHYEDSAVDWVRIYVYDNGNWDAYVDGDVRGSWYTDNADLTDYISTEAEAENVKVRYQIYNSGQVKEGHLDYAYLNITYTPPS